MFLENVYFCNTNARISAPGRILWYATKENESGFIFACSFLNEVFEGNGISLFKMFKNFGFYTQREARKLSTKSKAIIFSRTEIFQKRITYKDIKSIINDYEKRGLTLISVFPIKESSFFKIYEECMGYYHG